MFSRHATRVELLLFADAASTEPFQTYARRSVNMLRPSSTAGGLARAIRDVIDSVRRHFWGQITLGMTGAPFLLSAAVESALAGIAHEALSNAARHSGAPQVNVEIEFGAGGAVRLAVADAGAGFDISTVHPDSYGLISMQDRAMRGSCADLRH